MLAFIACALILPLSAQGVEITPFQTVNLSPLVQIFGIPSFGSARILPRGAGERSLLFDVANNFAIESNARENLVLDGELYRIAVNGRYGLGNGIELGIEVPFIGQAGGIFDGFIEGWHGFFGLPDENRQDFPHDRLLYLYQRGGRDQLSLTDSGFGIGDVRLLGGVRLYDDAKEAPRAVALRAALKVPTGESGKLHGSGSVDFSLWLTASDDYRLGWGHLTLFGGGGGMVMSNGEVLKDQHRNLAAFGTLGMGWSPVDWIAFKFQMNSNSPLYQSSDLRALNLTALQLIVGGTLAFSERTSLDIGVSEDVSVKTSPDVALHLGLKSLF